MIYQRPSSERTLRYYYSPIELISGTLSYQTNRKRERDSPHFPRSYDVRTERNTTTTTTTQVSPMVESSDQHQQQQQCPTATTTIDENHGDHTVTATVLPVVVATRKMTSDTVIGSCMGGDPSILGDSSSDHHPPRRHSSTIPTAAAAYDGGSLSTHDEETNHHNDNTAHKHRNNNQEHRFTTTLCHYLGRCWRQPFSGHRRGPTPAPHGTTTTDPKESHHLEERRWSLLSTAFRALLVRNMLYRRRNWISTVRAHMCVIVSGKGYRDGSVLHLAFFSLTH